MSYNRPWQKDSFHNACLSGRLHVVLSMTCLEVVGTVVDPSAWELEQLRSEVS